MTNPYTQYPQMRPGDTFRFKCQNCGKCCKRVANSVMVESLDLYRLAEFFKVEMSEAAEHYTKPVPIGWGAPVLMLKTTPPEDTCIFLKDGKCSVYPKRPRACRLYPLSVGPDENLKDFLIFNVSGEQQHFQGRWYRAQAWVDDNFQAVDRFFIQTEYRAMRECGQIMRRIPRNHEDDVLFQMLRWRYIQYEMDQSFLTQYIHNMQMLKNELEKLTK